MLSRLEEKGWLTRRKEGRGFVYAPSVAEEQGLAELAGDFQKKVFGGSPLALVQCLVRNKELRLEEINELRRLLDDAEHQLNGEDCK